MGYLIKIIGQVHYNRTTLRILYTSFLMCITIVVNIWKGEFDMFELLGVIGFLGLIVGTIMLVLAMIKKRSKKTSGIVLIASIIIFIIALVVTPPAEEVADTAVPKGKEIEKELEEKKPIEEEKKEETVVKEVEPTVLTWEDDIKNIANNTDAASDKFYAVEKIMADYEPTSEEIDQFKSEIMSSYKDRTYLNDIDNHEYMLSHIFMSYIVEQNSDGPLKDFAFDYHQNMKYTYRGVDTVDSEAVQSNERQMDKKMSEIE